MSYAEYALPHLRKLILASSDWEFPTAHMRPMSEGEGFYKIGKAKDVVLFFGDSNAMQYAPRIDRILTERKSSKSVVFATLGGLCPLPNVRRDPRDIAFTKKAMK